LLANKDQGTFDIKIADLGYACKHDAATGLDQVLGTPFYMAPELLQKEKYNYKADVWSFGVIVYQLLSGITPFNGRNIMELKKNILT
jgi:serine/threonine protein kinase